MKVSIITASFNNAKTIEDTIKSVASQTYQDIEYIIVDNCSTDETAEIVERYSAHISKFICESDKGIYDAFNKGIAHASGEIIGFLNSDDILFSNEIIAEVAKTFQAQNCDGVYGDLLYVNSENTSKVSRTWKSSEFSSKLLKKGWMPPHPTLYLKKTVYEKHGNFRTDLKISSDYDFCLRIFSQADLKFHYIPQILVKMRCGGVSNRSLKNIIRKSREDLKALRANKIGGLWTLFLKNFSKLRQF